MSLEELKTILGFGGIGIAALSIFVLYWAIRWMSEDKKDLSMIFRNHLHEHSENQKDSTIALGKDTEAKQALTRALTKLEAIIDKKIK